MSTSACVAAPHPAAVDAARAARAEGGNAVDMALAAATALAVVYPHQCSLGGDLVALVREPGGRVVAVVSAGAAPARVPVEALRAAAERMPPGGAHTVTVPGALAGWSALAGRGARLDLAHHLRRAADLAAAGARVAPGLARAIEQRRAVIEEDPGLRALLLPDGNPRAAGEPLLQPRLADTLRAIADDGAVAFYGGEVGRRLAAGLQRLGGTLHADDLATHEARIAAPLTARALGTTWWAAPPPTQGATLLSLLASLDAAPGAAARARGPHLAAVRGASAARDALLGDPLRGPVDVGRLLAGAAPEGGAGDTRAAGDTVAVTAADTDGRLVTLIQSVYQTFGAGILEPETGVVLHNRGSAFSLVRGHPAELAPGARPPHTLCPLLAETADGALVAAGCQGGRAQPQVLAQIAAALADSSADLTAALAAPRWVVGARDIGRERETLLAESGAHPPQGEADAAAIPVEWLPGRTDLAGHTQVARLAAGVLAAGSDPRADGRALVILDPEASTK